MKYKTEWMVFIALGIINIFIYGNKLIDLIKKIIEWGFVGNGFILIERYLNERFNKQENKDI